MITRAIVRFDVPITIDIPSEATTIEAQDEILRYAMEDVPKTTPKIIKCVERPDIVDKE